jgi:Fe-S oxidoreductase
LTSNYPATDAPEYSELLKCTHCGLCLNQCPTYRVLGWEMDSPRGRIRLMRGVTEGLFEVTPRFAEHMDVCLACRACQTACPASIGFGEMVEAARGQALQTLPQKPIPRLMRWLVLKQLFPHPNRLNFAAALLRFYQRSGLQFVARKLHLIPPGLRDSEALLPRLPDRFFVVGRTVTPSPLRNSSPQSKENAARSKSVGHAPRPSPLDGRESKTVAFLSGCVMGTVYADTNEATMRVLARNGYEVVIPRDQKCCGAIAIHSGERALAKEMAKRNIDAFTARSPATIPTPALPLKGEGTRDGDASRPNPFPHPQPLSRETGEGSDSCPILVNAAGCGVAMKEYKDLLKEDPEYADKAKEFSERVKDVSEFLAEKGIAAPTREVRARITYQDPCHLAHGQGVRAQPRSLLAQIPGLKLIEMRDSDRCCGSAGIYNITHPDISMQVLDEKMTNVRATEPEMIVTANAGCMLQLRLGARRAGMNVEVLHVMDLLDRAYGGE